MTTWKKGFRPCWRRCVSIPLDVREGGCLPGSELAHSHWESRKQSPVRAWENRQGDGLVREWGEVHVVNWRFMSPSSHPSEKAMAPPLPYSCLENPMDGGALKAVVHGVAEGRTRLSDFTFTFHLCIGEGNGNPLQCSCLENPRDGGAWWAAIYGVTQSWTWLKWLSSLPSICWSPKVMVFGGEAFGG